jgi:hypothetical protein
LPLRFDSRRKNEVNRTLLRFARQMVILFFILNFSFFLCSFLPEASCAKKLAHCGKSCFALLAVRLPGNSALQNKENLYLQIVNASNSPSSTYSSLRTQRTGPQYALKTLHRTNYC